MEWRFKVLTKNDTLQNASHLEFFHNEALNSSVDALVREDIQNRLDAKFSSEPFVEVRYKICGPTPSQDRVEWFTGLSPHLESIQVKDELGYQPSLENSLRWLVIEDFHTTGLEGDPMVFQDPDPALEIRNDFFWFVRNVGRSGKKGGDRGRWGLGKIVYPASSKIRSFFAYTVRKSDHQSLLIGRSVLAVHRQGENQHDSEGYFGCFNDPDHHYFATPESLPFGIEKFKRDFQIERLENEPGLSTVIPWPEQNITCKNLAASIIDHWFWVILEGRLKIQVSGENEPPLTITSENILSVILSLENNVALNVYQVARKLEFSKAVQDFDKSSVELFQLKLYPEGSAPKWDSSEDRFPNTENLTLARDAFHEGKLIGFNIPVNVKRVDGTVSENASFQVYLKKTEELTLPIEVFLREGLCISGQKFLREAGILALIKTEHDALGTLLGDAENPAHTRWERSGKHFKDKYLYGPSILSYVQRSAQNISALLSRKAEGIDKDLLQEFFYIPESGTSTAPQPKRGHGKSTPTVPALPPKIPYIECSRINNGFRLKRHSRAVSTPIFIQVRVAYEVIKGNPFKLHHPADFDLSDPRGLNLQLSGLTIHSSSPNKILFSVTGHNFESVITGFDKHRDLVIDVKPIKFLDEATADDASESGDLETSQT